MKIRIVATIALSTALLGGCASGREAWNRTYEIVDDVEDLEDLTEIEDADDVDDIVNGDLWELVERRWPGRSRTDAASRWTRLTAEDLDDIDGEREELIETIAERYDVSEAQATAEVDAWARAR